jgi:hypothetical protein
VKRLHAGIVKLTTISGFPLLVERYDDTTGLGTLV